MVAECRVADVANDEGDILGALERSKVMAVRKHTSRSEVASASKVAVCCEGVPDLVDVTNCIAQLGNVLPSTICCRTPESHVSFLRELGGPFLAQGEDLSDLLSGVPLPI